MPVVIASMLTATSEPRTFAGTSSAMYIGEIKEAMPMASPLATLSIISQVTVGASAEAMALAVKIMPARIISARRPKRSVRMPPIAAPHTAPTKTALTTISSMADDSRNCALTNRIAPEMTPVS
jgi:hypothetical protein